MGVYHGLSGWVQCDHRVLLRGSGPESRQRCDSADRSRGQSHETAALETQEGHS